MQNLTSNIKIRRNYSKVKSSEAIPGLMEMQKNSYMDFLQLGTLKSKRKNIGLQRVLSSIFPLHSRDGKFELEFVEYSLGEVKANIDECKQRDMTYSIPVTIVLRLIANDINKETGTVSVKDVKEQAIYLCDIPLMTDHGTFVINGAERVVVSQIYRSPGIFFDSDKGKANVGKFLYSASIIPHIGSWLDIEFDAKDLLYIRVDKRKKVLLTSLLRSLDSKATEELRVKAAKEGKELDSSLVAGMSAIEILDTFYNCAKIEFKENKYIVEFKPEFYESTTLAYDLINAKDGTVVVKQGTYVSAGVLKKLLKSEVSHIVLMEDDLIGNHVLHEIKDSKSNVLAFTGQELTKELLANLVKENVTNFSIVLIDHMNSGAYLLNTLLADKATDRFKALNEIYKTVKGADATNVEVANDLLNTLFFDYNRYDLSAVGRFKINEKFGLKDPEDLTILNKSDIINVIKHLLLIRDGKAAVDDIDNLANRRIRSVGELVENELRISLVRMERFIHEKMATSEELAPSDIINVKAIQSALRDFFGTSQLSQFMDQTNPLSEITHKRRVSALGPKGLTRERASFEVRDVHLTHYGRICPIETPEGPNIGLINSLAIYARINKYGFLETPYRLVKDGKVLNEVVYMGAFQEKDHVIAQANTLLDKNDKFVDDLITCRINGELTLCEPSEVTCMDVAANQMVSVAASLVPFLENDDANRALMGANMQRQAVPLLKAEAPIVGTGMEAVVAKDSGVSVVANRRGVVHNVDAFKIIVKALDENNIAYDIDVYHLNKFQRSNHNTCINQKPIVKAGDLVDAGDVIADGHSVDKGELALGKNVLVAFMPWNGYNFEDSILISERIVRDDVFTSIHIEEFEVVARDTKLGPEEITADIPNISEDASRSLDESGVIYAGAEVVAGDILVGKVTPKAESIVTAEEKLLRAIFGEKAADVKDTSLRVPSGISGTVIGVRVFSRRGIAKDSRVQANERIEFEKLSKERDQEYSILDTSYVFRIADLLHKHKVVNSKIHKKDEILDKAKLVDCKLSDLFQIVVKDKEVSHKLSEAAKDFNLSVTHLNAKFENKIANLQKGDDLPAGVMKMVKVFIAVKRKLQPGDKMAGRHGNKGVVSKILPIEDMPHLEDGTPVDICLNPLGVPSRMNVGQVLEVHLGWAAANIGKQVNSMLEQYHKSKQSVADIRKFLASCYGTHEADSLKELKDQQILDLAKNLKKGLPVATSVFDGVKEKDINELLTLSKLDTSGQMRLIDGRTGEYFERSVTVGYIYMLKLHHLVDDKIHARSIGPYSLITQQPLGGKAQFGGQRFGEMEVWALEAYGAAYILQEMLTVKSDDQTGRTHVYESIIKGDETFETGVPESFNVLVKELRSLCLNLEMHKKEE
ncbi:DNA-directed RNA polymerase subunit beta [Candidatus Hepatincola sp. Pdp]